MQLVYRLLPLLFLLLACGSEATTSAIKTGTDGQVSIAQFNQLLKTKPSAQLVDVRTPKEFANGHLEGAINIDYKNANFSTAIEQLDKSKPVFVYCQAGGRSGKAYKRMKAMGFKEVYDMKEGYRGVK